MSLKTFDFKKVSVIIGPHIASGFADGTGIAVEYNEDRFITQVGSDAEVTRSKSNDNTGTFTLTLQHASKTNDVLSGYKLLDDASNAGIFPVLIKDLQGNTVAEGTSCWVQSTPSVEFGREAADREWVIATDDLKLFVGGLN